MLSTSSRCIAATSSLSRCERRQRSWSGPTATRMIGKIGCQAKPRRLTCLLQLDAGVVVGAVSALRDLRGLVEEARTNSTLHGRRLLHETSRLHVAGKRLLEEGHCVGEPSGDVDGLKLLADLTETVLPGT